MNDNQCDQFGQFFKVLVTNFLEKLTQMHEKLLGYFENITFQVKTTFGAIFLKN